MTSPHSGGGARPRGSSKSLDLVSHSERMLRVHRKNLVHAWTLKKQLDGLDGECERRVNRIRHEIHQLYFSEQLPREREILRNQLEQTELTPQRKEATLPQQNQSTVFYQIFHKTSTKNNSASQNNKKDAPKKETTFRLPSPEKTPTSHSQAEAKVPGRTEQKRKIPLDLPPIPSIVGPIQTKLDTIRLDRERTLMTLRDAPPSAEEYLASMRKKRLKEGPPRSKSVCRAEKIGRQLKEAGSSGNQKKPNRPNIAVSTASVTSGISTTPESHLAVEITQDSQMETLGTVLLNNGLPSEELEPQKTNGVGGKNYVNNNSKLDIPVCSLTESDLIDASGTYPSESGTDTSRLLEDLVKMPLTRKLSRTKEMDSLSDPGKSRKTKPSQGLAVPFQDFLNSIRGVGAEDAGIIDEQFPSPACDTNVATDITQSTTSGGTANEIQGFGEKEERKVKSGKKKAKKRKKGHKF